MVLSYLQYKKGYFMDVKTWIDGPWVRVSSDIAGSSDKHLEEMCALVERAKNTLLISASNCYSIRSQPDLYTKFIKAVREKLQALKEGKFGHIVVVCDRKMFAIKDAQGEPLEAPLIDLIREFIEIPNFQVLVGSGHLYNHAIIVDDVRGLIESEHKETGPKSYKTFGKSSKIAYLVRVAAQYDQHDNARVQPLLIYHYKKEVLGLLTIDEWLSRIFFSFYGTKEEWDATHKSDWASTTDENQKIDLGFLEEITTKRLTRFFIELGFDPPKTTIL